MFPSFCPGAKHIWRHKVKTTAREEQRPCSAPTIVCQSRSPRRAERALWCLHHLALPASRSGGTVPDPGPLAQAPRCPTSCARFAHALWPRLSGSSRDGKDTTTHPPRDQCQREPEAVRGRGGSARRLAGNRQAPPAAPSRVAATDLGDSCCKQTPLDPGTWGIREEVEDLCGC